MILFFSKLKTDYLLNDIIKEKKTNFLSKTNFLNAGEQVCRFGAGIIKNHPLKVMTAAGYIGLPAILARGLKLGINIIPRNQGELLTSGIVLACSGALSVITSIACRAIHFLTSRNARMTAAVSGVIAVVSLVAFANFRNKWAYLKTTLRTYENNEQKLKEVKKILTCKWFYWYLKDLSFNQLNEPAQKMLKKLDECQSNQLNEPAQKMLKKLDECQREFFELYSKEENSPKKMEEVCSEIRRFFEGDDEGTYLFFNKDNLKSLNEKIDEALKVNKEETPLVKALKDLKEQMQVENSEGESTELGKFADWQQTLDAENGKLRKHLKSIEENASEENKPLAKICHNEMFRDNLISYDGYRILSMIIAIPSLLIGLYSGAVTAAPIINRYWKKL